MKTLFVLDASGYIYSSYFAIRNMTNHRGESTNALFGFVRSVMKLIKDFHPTHMVAVFDGPRNAKKREELFADYKAHRAAMPPDLLHQIDWAREFCSLLGLSYLNIPEVEADDTMGSIAKWAAEKGATVYLCTSDKDMAQLVNDKIAILNTRKDNQIIHAKEVEEIYGVPPNRIVDLLALTGDSSDNVPGVPGIGPKTAASLLNQYGSLNAMFSASPDKSTPKKWHSVIENADKAELSRQLVTIDISVPIPKTAEDYAIKSSDVDNLKAFYADKNFNSLIKELEVNIQHDTSKEHSQKHHKNDEVEHYHTIDDEAELAKLVTILSKEKILCVDTETTDIRPLRAELVGIGLGIKPHEAWYIPTNGNLSLHTVIKHLKPLFENPNIGFYGHNIKYDYHILANCGIQIANICFDTLLASYLLNSHNRQHSLDALSLQYFGKVKIPTSNLIGKGKGVITMREVAIDKVAAYCCEDVDYTSRLKEILEPEIQSRGLDKLMDTIEVPLIKVLAEMERHGIFLDLHLLKKTTEDVIKDIRRAERHIYDIAGEEFNLNSPKQLSHILRDKLKIHLPKKTATGHSTNADVLEQLAEDYPIANAILEFRGLEKLRSTYLESLPHDINPITHRIHCTFNQSVAATGRLSCQDPNLQNIPIRTELGGKIREAFRPQLKEWSYLSADYSQIELRLLAHFSEDPNMIAAFQKKEDIHTSTAAAIFGIPLNQVTREQRHHAKAVNFGIIYGQQAYGLAKELKIDVKSAATFIETYFHRFENVKQYLESCKQQARKTGKAITYMGRERAIPEIKSPNQQLRTLAERLAVNTPLQGTAADLIKIAMLKIDAELSKKKLKSYMILQIHDELIFEAPDEELDILEPLIKKHMQEVFELKVPLVVDISIGKNWKEC